MSDLSSSPHPEFGRVDPNNREIELTLHVDPDGLERIASRYNFLSSSERTDNPLQDRQQNTTYFDTGDLALFRSGVALRLREEDGTLVQTLKTVNAATVADSAGVAVRQEWDWPVTVPVPDPSLLDKDGLGILVPRPVRDQLTALFTTKVRRRSWLMHPDSLTSVEVALDQGETRLGTDPTGKKRQRICEVELELKEGRVAQLFAMALSIHAINPVRIATESKGERGFRLASGRAVKAVPPDRISLSPFTTVGEALRHALRDSIRLLLANGPSVQEQKDPLGLAAISHALRRIDSFIRLFRPVLPGPEPRQLNAGLRRLRQAVDHALLWDCLLTALQEDEAEGLLHAVRQAAMTPLAEAANALTTPDTTETVLRLAFWIEDGRWASEADEATRALLGQPLNSLSAPWLAMMVERVREAGKTLDTAKGRNRLHRRLHQLFDAKSLMTGLTPADWSLPLNEQTALTLMDMLESASLADRLSGALDQTPLAQDRSGRRAAIRLNRQFSRDGARALKALPALWRMTRRPQAGSF